MTDASFEGPALVVQSPGKVGFEQRHAEQPKAGEVLVIPHFVGLCGTDLEIIDGQLDPAYTNYPLVLGHEWSGRVAAVGQGVTAFKPQDAVVVEGIIPDSTCAACRAGRTNMCENYDELGFTRDGAAGPAVTVPHHLAHALSASVPVEAGALVEPAAVSLRALTEITLAPGQEVLVIGDGTVALLTTQLLTLWSPESITMAGRRPEQEDMALACGAKQFILDVPPPRAFDVVVEAAGGTAAAEAAFASAKPGGQVLLLGIAGHGKSASLLVDEVVNHDLSIRGSFSYTATAWAATVKLINSGRFDPTTVITHRFAIDDFTDALELLRIPDGKPRGKIMLEMRRA